MHYYNELDPYPARWLSRLAEENLIPKGYIDERNIRELGASDVRRYRQCHFFAGIAGWSRALELAGWPDDRPVWTDSCPCQPFSQAGKRRAFDDPRDLWPVWRKLIAECRPATIFGEQVDGPDGFLWLNRVRTDLEKIGYAVGAAVLPAACVNSPHQRHRIWWLADADGGQSRHRHVQRGGEYRQQSSHGAVSRLAVAESKQMGRTGFSRERTVDRMADTEMPERRGSSGAQHTGRRSAETRRPSEVVYCADGKWRRIEPSTFPLAYDVPKRVGRLRAYGNAIIPEVAAEFIMAFMETET